MNTGIIFALSASILFSAVALAEGRGYRSACSDRWHFGHGHSHGHGYGHAFHGHHSGGHCHDDDDYDDDDDDDDQPSHRRLRVMEQQDLRFPTVPGGEAQTVTVLPDDATAAVFSVRGKPRRWVQVWIKEKSTQMRARSGRDKIKARRLTLGGSVDRDGFGQLNRRGILENIRVGGTARVRSKNAQTHYVGTLTLRVQYVD